MENRYKQKMNLFNVDFELERALTRICPEIKHVSGIYVWYRHEEDTKYTYVGKAKDLIRRSISHLQGYKQRIDISLRKRGLYDEKYNPGGWSLKVKYIPYNQLDEFEQKYIDYYKNNGYELYNIESGGTTGKTLINERKLGKNYYDGLKQGKQIIIRELQKMFSKYLKAEMIKDGILSHRMLNKFNKLIGGEVDNGS